MDKSGLLKNLVSPGAGGKLQQVSEEAMEVLKKKIGILKYESAESSQKMAAAEKAKAEALERIKVAEGKVRELSKQIHSRKILLDANEDKVQKNTVLARRKEEAAIEARQEIKNLILREMTLKSEVERVNAALPATGARLCEASAKADQQLSEVKKLEIRAMLADQTVEEMEEQLEQAIAMTNNTNQKTEEMSKRLEARQQELKRALERADRTTSRLEAVQSKLKAADRKMAGMQFALEDKARTEHKYKKQIQTLQAKHKDAEQRAARDIEFLTNLKRKVDKKIKK